MAVWDIFHDADFCCLDHDDYLTTCYSDAEKEEFVKDWCDRHAESMLPRNDPDFPAVSKTFLKQLVFVKKQPKDNPLTCQGGEILKQINVSNNLSAVLEAVRKLIVYAEQTYGVSEYDLGVEIHECEEDYKVRQVLLACSFDEFQDGTRTRYNYRIEFYGY